VQRQRGKPPRQRHSIHAHTVPCYSALGYTFGYTHGKKPMSTRTRGTGTIYQQKTGKKLWVAAVELRTYDGKRRRLVKRARTRAEAATKLRELLATPHHTPTTRHTTLGDWLTTWQTDILRPHVSPATHTAYSAVIRRYITPAIGAVKLSALTPHHVRHAIKTTPHPSSRQRVHQVLGLALDAAIHDGLIPEPNVARQVRRPQHTRADTTAFDRAIVRKLLDAAQQLDARPNAPQLATRWLAGVLLGARRGELLGLEWNRVDFTNATITIDWQLQAVPPIHGCGAPTNGQWPCGHTQAARCPAWRRDIPEHVQWRPCTSALIWTRPKTRSSRRVVPIDGPLLPMLQQHAARTAAPNPHGLVWHHPDGRPISPRADYRAWCELLKLAGVPHAKLHTLRHTAATLLHQNSTAAEVRMQLMGHSSHLVHAGYVHIDMAQERAALRALGELLDTDQ
jgi:integrase